MKENKKGIVLLAAFQFGLAVMSGSSQVPHTWQTGTGIVFFSTMTLYTAFMVVLTILANREKRAFNNTAITAVLTGWLVSSGSNVVAIVLSGRMRLDLIEKHSLQRVAISLVVLAIIRLVTKKPIRDPMMIGLAAFAMQVIPRIGLMETIVASGAHVMSLKYIAIGFVSITMRMYMISRGAWKQRASMRGKPNEEAWRRATSWSLASDTLNFVSWVAVTMTWAKH